MKRNQIDSNTTSSKPKKQKKDDTLNAESTDPSLLIIDSIINKLEKNSPHSLSTLLLFKQQLENQYQVSIHEKAIRQQHLAITEQRYALEKRYREYKLAEQHSEQNLSEQQNLLEEEKSQFQQEKQEFYSAVQTHNQNNVVLQNQHAELLNKVTEKEKKLKEFEKQLDARNNKLSETSTEIKDSLEKLQQQSEENKKTILIIMETNNRCEHREKQLNEKIRDEEQRLNSFNEQLIQYDQTLQLKNMELHDREIAIYNQEQSLAVQPNSSPDSEPLADEPVIKALRTQHDHEYAFHLTLNSFSTRQTPQTQLPHSPDNSEGSNSYSPGFFQPPTNAVSPTSSSSNSLNSEHDNSGSEIDLSFIDFMEDVEQNGLTIDHDTPLESIFFDQENIEADLNYFDFAEESSFSCS